MDTVEAMSDLEDAYLIRTTFEDDAVWEQIVMKIRAPRIIGNTECFAYVKLIEDTKYRGLDPVALVHSLPDDYPQYFAFVVDDLTTSNAEHPILVVNFLPEFAETYGTLPRERDASEIESFRAVPETIQSIENNLSIGNMGFEEFAESVDSDGVFRGFE